MNKKEITALALVALTANALTVLQSNLKTRKPKKSKPVKSPEKDFDGLALRAASSRVARKQDMGGYSTTEQMIEDLEFELIAYRLK